jgi:uncharacterized repeat protein (TIGR03803 family)
VISNALGVLHSFPASSSDGASPQGSLLLVTGSTSNFLYGMTTQGGLYSSGTIFSYNLGSSAYTKLYDFSSTTGYFPSGDLIIVGNILYGMTEYGGAHSSGVIFSYDLNTNTYTDLFDFNGGTDGLYPTGSLTYAATAGGTLYGMTSGGGANGYGALISYNLPTASEIVVVSCALGGPNGAGSPHGSLAMAGNELFGMTWEGGSLYDGNVFSCNPAAVTPAFNNLDMFANSNGENPYGNVTLSSGVMYGMASSGGILGGGGDGVIFKLGPVCDLGIDTSATITCSGYGGLSVSPFYGATPYTYSWSTGATTSSISGQPAGSYTVTVTDANGCSATQSMVLSQPAALTLSLSNQYCDHVSNTGGGSVNPSGGTSPYTYLWEPGGEHGADQVGLSGGTYTITVTDYNGCTATITMNICGVHGASRHEQEEDSITQIMNGISLYPNPSNGQFTITGLQSGMYIEVYDYTGRLVSNTTVSIENMQVNLSEMPNGIYLVRMMSAGGTLVKQTKIVKVE